jgi:hypothetical protein
MWPIFDAMESVPYAVQLVKTASKNTISRMLRCSVRDGPHRGGLDSKHASSTDYDVRDDKLRVCGHDCLVDTCDDDANNACQQDDCPTFFAP